MKRTKFINVANGIYYLPIPHGEQNVGITLVKGETAADTVLIDTGASDQAITHHLLPALKAENMTAKSIGTVLFTHFHPDNIGGIHALRRENPRIRIIVPRGFKELLLNPMVNILNEREKFPMHNPPFNEIKGVFPDREMSIDEETGVIDIAGLCALRVSGHAEGVCWFHTATKTLICGDALQGNGNALQGMPHYTAISKYRASLNRLSAFTVDHLVCSREMDGVSCISHGDSEYKTALRRCAECVTDTGKAIKEMLDNGVTDTEAIARELSIKNFGTVPEALTYAMQTVTAHIRERSFE